MSRLAALKAGLQKNTQTGNTNNNYYPFYRMGVDEKATIRFLPDKNPMNPLAFLFEKVVHTYTTDEKKNVTVPCMSMYGEECPVCKKAAEFFKAEGKESANGRALYKKRQHVAQVLVVKDPLPYKEGEEPATGQFRLISLTSSIISKIQTAIADDELDESPDDYARGTDFTIRKQKKGDYANYDNSKFERSERALSEAEIALAEEKSIDLSTLRPQKPTSDVLVQFIDSYLNGTPFVPNGQGGNSGQSTQRPSGYSNSQASANPSDFLSQSSAQQTPAPAASQPAAKSVNDEANDILNAILNRQ